MSRIEVTEEEKAKIGQRIRRARELRGISQEKLGELMGANTGRSAQSIAQQLESGKSLGIKKVMEAARVLECPVDFLLYDAPSAWDKMFEGKEGEPSGMVASLNEQIKALQARLEYQEKLIAEKDKRIEGLETLVTVLRELKKGKR